MTWYNQSWCCLLRWLAGLLWSLALFQFEATAQTNAFFTPGLVHQISLSMAGSGVSKLRHNPRADVDVICEVDGAKVPGVVAHLKGSTGSFRNLDDKPAFTLKVAGSGSSQFDGASKIHLNNSVEDPSYLCEVVGQELFQEANIPVPLTTHAIVFLNGKRLGLYVVKEGLTEAFFARISPNPGGLLEPLPKMDVDGRQDWKAGDKRWLKDFEEAQKDLSNVLNVPDTSTRWELLSPFLDRESAAKFFAMEVALGHRDGYSMARNNYRLLWDAKNRKLAYLPHGMDQLFARADYPWCPEMSGAVARAMVASPEGKAAYRKALSAIVFEPNRLARMTNRVDQLMAFLTPALTAIEVRSVRESATDLQSRMIALWQFFQRDLSSASLAAKTFTNGLTALDGWKPVRDTTGGELLLDLNRFYLIRAIGDTSASWRTTVLLAKGHYRFEAAAALQAVVPLDFGRNKGAGLRVLGRDAAPYEAVGNVDTQRMLVEFEVAAVSEEIVLILELRAKVGEVRFDGAELKLRRLE